VREVEIDISHEHKPLSTYYVVMDPYNSLLSLITKLADVNIYVYGVFKLGNNVSSMIRCEFQDKNSYNILTKALRESDKVISLKVINKKPTSCFMVVEKKNCHFYDYTLGENRLILFPYVIKEGLRHFIIFTKKYNYTKDFYKEISIYGKIIKLKRINLDHALEWVESLKISDILRSMLTPMQLRVIEEAIKGGYYSWPRKSKMSELSRRLGISKTTISEHLRKGEQKLISLLLGHISKERNNIQLIS